MSQAGGPGSGKRAAQGSRADLEDEALKQRAVFARVLDDGHRQLRHRLRKHGLHGLVTRLKALEARVADLLGLLTAWHGARMQSGARGVTREVVRECPRIYPLRHQHPADTRGNEAGGGA